jgi:hypothetical protein
MSLIIYHPLTQPGKPNSLSQDIKDRLFMASIEIIEYSRVLESEASTKQWGWLFHTYFQWHAIAYILGELAQRPNSLIVERAWRAMDFIFADWGGVVSKTRTGMLWQPLSKLLARAQRRREENMASHQSNKELGIDGKYMRPPPSRTSANLPPGEFAGIARDRQASLNSSPITTTNGFHAVSNCQFPGQSEAADAEVPMQPQIVGMGPQLAPEQMQAQFQQQAQQQQMMQPTPWIMDNDALLDLDMQGLDGDAGWEGWDAMVRDFHMENDVQGIPAGEMRGPALGGMGNWW